MNFTNIGSLERKIKLFLWHPPHRALSDGWTGSIGDPDRRCLVVGRSEVDKGRFRPMHLAAGFTSCGADRTGQTIVCSD